MDLFTSYIKETPPEKDTQQRLADAMQKQWDRDQEEVKKRRVIPDWIGEPSPLSKDRARLLELLYDVGCVEWTSNSSQNNELVTKAMGLKNPANARAVIKMCEIEGLIVSRLYRGKQVWEMTMAGEHALEDHLLEREMGFL